MFDHRDDAGQQIASRLQERGITPDVVVAYTRGGLVVGNAIRKQTSAPLTLLPANHIDAPFNDQLPIGAVTYRGTAWLNEDLINRMEIGPTYIDDGIRVEEENALEHAEQYNTYTADVDGKTVVVATDGVTGGERALATVRQLYRDGASTVIIATPVVPQDTADTLQQSADDIVYLETPEPFLSVHRHYREFPDISEEAARTYLDER